MVAHDLTVQGVMGLLADTQHRGLCKCRECRERFPRHRLQRKPLDSNPGMHHVHVHHTRAVVHVGITKPQWRGKTFPAFPAHAQLAILHIWQEAHAIEIVILYFSSFITGMLKSHHVEGILPKGPYMPCVSMAVRAPLAGYHRCEMISKAMTGKQMNFLIMHCWSLL